MTIEIRSFDSLGAANFGWLDAKHHFSFGHYYDPRRMNVGPLRVWNDDTIQPGTGFDAHPHRDMEIITYVREGAITHKDNIGNVGRTEAGDIQVMSAGTGIVHAEYNLEDVTTKIFQIWIVPRSKGTAPRWETKAFPRGEQAGTLIPLASGRTEYSNVAPIDQDATLFAGTLPKGTVLDQPIGKGRMAYVVPAKGYLQIGDEILDTRDGAVISGTDSVRIEAMDDAEVILVDVPADWD